MHILHSDSSWRPLNSAKSEIRILEVFPALSPAESIICHLRTVSLHDQPEYEALSYVWGDSSDSRQIILNRKIFQVTNNLFRALKRLRDVDKARTLWVDAICINQTDDAEKNVQVLMMGKIYAHASRVLVWLSKDEPPNLLRHIMSFGQNQEKHFIHFPISVCDLTGIAWWNRAWTFQEAALARNLIFYIGNKCFALEDIERYCSSMRRHLFQPNACCRAVLDTPVFKGIIISCLSTLQQLFDSREAISQGRQNLLDLIIDNNDRKATNPQDKVYAYLGLAFDAPLAFVRYELPLKEWTIHTATEIIQKSKSLRLIRLTTSPGVGSLRYSGTDGLPSWCPDWQQHETDRISYKSYYGIQQHFIGLDQRFAAAAQTEANPFFPTAEILGLPGVLCDKVTHVGRISPFTDSPAYDPYTLGRWCHLVANNTSVHHARCDGCNRIIYGTRNKCLACPDFNLCSRCFGRCRGKHPHRSFSSIRSRPSEPQDDSDEQGKAAESPCSAEQIMEISVLQSMGLDTSEVQPIQETSWGILSEMDYPFSESDTIQDAFRKVLTADTPVLPTTGDISGAEPNLQEMAFNVFWVTKVENQLQGEFPIQNDLEGEVSLMLKSLTKESIDLVANAVALTVYEKRLFISSKGYIGWGPNTMCPGDTIAVLHGSNMPFVVRALPEQPAGVSSGSGYTMVGECYVHGLMNGEAFGNAEMEKRDFLLY